LSTDRERGHLDARSPAVLRRIGAAWRLLLVRLDPYKFSPRIGAYVGLLLAAFALARLAPAYSSR
jgi:hypothetical protein